MLTTYTIARNRLRASDVSVAQATWIDLLQPTYEETIAVEEGLALSVPTREDMEEIEISSRLYAEDGTYFLTALLPANADGAAPEMAPVSFVLHGNHLVTIRFHEPKAFATFATRADRADTGCIDANTVLLGLLETIVDRLADLLEHAGARIDALSRRVFRTGENAGPKPNFQEVLKELGRNGDFNSNIRDSLVTLERMAGYLSQVFQQRDARKDQRERAKTLGRDVRSLTDHANFLSGKITFLLDATLGMISIEQNDIIKIFSIVAVIFLPPTLIASIYGMNFTLMPELDWPFGYPLALGLMIASGAGTLYLFKRRGWL